jgi:hypothetical protein
MTEDGLRPVGAIGAYAPEGMRKRKAKGKRLGARGIGQNYEVGSWNTERIADCKDRVDYVDWLNS